MDASKFLNMLLHRKAMTALEAMEKPVGNDAFGYGLSVGVVRGYTFAIQMLQEQIAGEAEKGKDL